MEGQYPTILLKVSKGFYEHIVEANKSEEKLRIAELDLVKNKISIQGKEYGMDQQKLAYPFHVLTRSVNGDYGLDYYPINEAFVVKDDLRAKPAKKRPRTIIADSDSDSDKSDAESESVSASRSFASSGTERTSGFAFKKLKTEAEIRQAIYDAFKKSKSYTKQELRDETGISDKDLNKVIDDICLKRVNGNKTEFELKYANN